MLVSSVDAFNRYQLEEAWIWELQSLTRARPFTGDKETANRFKSIRKNVLTMARDKTLIKTEVLSMRQRIRNEHDDTNSLKHGHGGLLDIEFIVQLGLLLNAESYPEVIRSTQASDQLQALHDCGWIDASTFKTLDNAYAQLSHARLHAALVDGGTGFETISLLGIAQALCEEILG